ncbi:MAG: SsrA-binding protein [Endomicrobium sp.]|jgi:SsrA-binding protein|nr:SsrA-binding protein [Endomicrobium sp.]
MKKNTNKILSTNRKVYFNYEIISKLEVGIVLHGNEVKAMKNGNVSFNGSIIKFNADEAFIENMFISKYQYATTTIDYNYKRSRKLLMHKDELRKIHIKIKEKGYTIMPLEVYINHKGIIKLLICLAKGRKLYDKREYIRNRDIKKEILKNY